MKFDIIIGNPPYNNQLWTSFFRWAIKHNPQHIVFVTPDTWQQSTRLLKLFSQAGVLQWWSAGNPWMDVGITTTVAITHINCRAVSPKRHSQSTARWQWGRSQHCIAICRSRMTRDDTIVVVVDEWQPSSGQWTWLTCNDESEANRIRAHILQNAIRLNRSRHAGWLNQKLLLELLNEI